MLLWHFQIYTFLLVLSVVVLYGYKQGKQIMLETCFPLYNNKKRIFIQDDVVTNTHEAHQKLLVKRKNGI